MRTLLPDFFTSRAPINRERYGACVRLKSARRPLRKRRLRSRRVSLQRHLVIDPQFPFRGTALLGKAEKNGSHLKMIVE